MAHIFEEQAGQFLSQKEELQASLDAMSSLVANDKERIRLINNEFVDLRKQISDSEFSMKEKDETIGILNGELKSLQDSIELLRGDCFSLRASAVTLQEEKKCLEDAMHASEKDKGALHGLINDIKHELDSFKSEIETLNADKKGLQESTLKFAVEINELRRQADQDRHAKAALKVC